MSWKIIQLLLSISLIIGGLSGNFVLRGTNSSAALVAVGLLWLAFDVIQLIIFKKKPKESQLKRQRKGRSPLFFIFCGIYIIANLVCVFFLFDELLYVPDRTVMETLAICGNVISLVGIVFTIVKKHYGIIVALAGSAFSIVFTILSGIFIIGVTPHFDTEGFVVFMLIGLLPGFILWLQMKHENNKSTITITDQQGKPHEKFQDISSHVLASVPTSGKCCLCGKTINVNPDSAVNLEEVARFCVRCGTDICVSCLRKQPKEGRFDNKCPVCGEFVIFEINPLMRPAGK